MAEKIEFEDGWYNVFPVECGLVEIKGRKSWAVEYRVQVPGYEEPVFRTKFCNFDSDVGMDIMVNDASLLGCVGDIPKDWKIDPEIWNDDKAEPLRMLFETQTNPETGEQYPQQAKTLAKSKPFEHTPGFLVKKFGMSEDEKAATMVGIEDRVKLARARTEAFRASKAAEKAAGASTGSARVGPPRGAGGKAAGGSGGYGSGGSSGGSQTTNDVIPPGDDFGGEAGGDEDIPFGRNVELSW